MSSSDSARSGKNNIPYPNNTTVPLTNAAAMRRYIQYYTYDNVGNMLSMQHTNTSGSGNWTRNYTISGSSNRLTGSSIGSNGSSTDSYTYDNRGNLVAGMNHLNSGGTSMNYNAANRLESVVITSTITAYYQYDGSGQRVRKTLVNTAASTTEVRKYLGDWEVYGRTVGSTLVLERQTLHLSDDRGRVALIDTPTVDTLGTGEVQLLRYQYSNHLGTATLELDDDASVIDYEEYYPFGATSFQSGRSLAEVSLKRYRYTGKERDEETGLYYHGARYYAPWIARWTAVDPLEGKYTPWSSYNYCEDNPVRLVDPSGMGGEDKVPAHWVKAGSRDDVFSEDGTNRYGYNEGYVDVKGDGRYKKYTAEQYWAEFGGNDDYRPAFYQNNPNPGKATAFAPKQKTKVADPLPVPVQQPISSPQPVATTNGEDGSVLNTVVDVAIGLTPFVGSGRDLYEGIKTGSVLLAAIGAGGLLLDFSTFGLASAFKGGIKATLLMFAKKGLENAAEAEAKNVVVDVAKGGTKLISQFSTSTIDDAVSLVMRDPNKVAHLFPAKHNLGSLVTKLGGQENTVRAVLNAANGKLPASGVFNNIPVNVGGSIVFVRGNVINGVPRLGTMFIP